jgi:hypothetical protein
MSAHQKRHRHTPKAAPTFFAAALPPKPPGEDFFLVAVVIDSDDPCWNDGFDIVGSWELELTLTGANLVSQNLLVLIGRDILRHCVLVYNGPLGCYTLAF